MHFAQMKMSIIQIAIGCIVVYNCKRDQNILLLIRVLNKVLIAIFLLLKRAAGVAP